MIITGGTLILIQSRALTDKPAKIILTTSVSSISLDQKT